jgi:hemerythrin
MGSLYEWKDSYSVKVNQIDQQHKTLFSLINDLHSAMKLGKAGDVVAKTLEGLISYTKTHFRDEEAMLSKAKYPLLPQHKAIHDGFIAKIVELQQKSKSGNLSLSIEMLQFLGEWIKNHILQTDRQYSAFLSAKA